VFNPRIFLILLFAIDLAHGEEIGGRADLIDSYVKHSSENPGLYQSPPIYHLVPSFNTITYALGVELVDIVISPENPLTHETKTIDLKGSKYEPHVAVSLKNLSLGFSALKETLTESYSYSQGSGSPYAYQKQQSTINLSGIGFNIAFVPFPKLHSKLKLAFILSGKSLAAKHSVSNIDYSNTDQDFSSSDFETLNYNIYKYSTGVNLNWHFLKRFSIIPWVDFTRTDFKSAETVLKSSKTFYNERLDATQKDWQLFFKNQSQTRYGLDLAADFFGIEVRFGGLFGSIANLNKSVDYIKNGSLVLSASFEQKGN
jgi:hypothetical protein